MTLYQKTLVTYAKGQKEMAFLAYKSDETANKKFNSFADFCTAFDGLMQKNKNNSPSSSAQKHCN